MDYHVCMTAPIGSPISTIPDETMLQIFSFLDLRDLFSAMRVCCRWKHIARDNSLWKELVPPLPQRLCITRDIFWRIFKHIKEHGVEELYDSRTINVYNSMSPKARIIGFPADGSLIAFAHPFSNYVYFEDRQNSMQLGPALFFDNLDRCPPIAFAKDGSQVAIADDAQKTIRLWERESFEVCTFSVIGSIKWMQYTSDAKKLMIKTVPKSGIYLTSEEKVFSLDIESDERVTTEIPPPVTDVLTETIRSADGQQVVTLGIGSYGSCLDLEIIASQRVYNLQIPQSVDRFDFVGLYSNKLEEGSIIVVIGESTYFTSAIIFYPSEEKVSTLLGSPISTD